MIASTRWRWAISSRCAGPQKSAPVKHIGLHVDVARRHEIVEHGGVGVERDVLEGAGDAEGSASVGRKVRDVLAFKDDSAGLGGVEAVDAVDQAGLAGTVGTDDGEDFARCDLEADFVQGFYAAEIQGDVIDMQLDRHVTPSVSVAESRGPRRRLRDRATLRRGVCCARLRYQNALIEANRARAFQMRSKSQSRMVAII